MACEAYSSWHVGRTGSDGQVAPHQAECLSVLAWRDHSVPVSMSFSNGIRIPLPDIAPDGRLSGVSDTFTCANCGETFPKGWSDEEAQAEAEAIFTPAELAATDIVCDDCFKLAMEALPRLRAEC